MNTGTVIRVVWTSNSLDVKALMEQLFISYALYTFQNHQPPPPSHTHTPHKHYIHVLYTNLVQIKSLHQSLLHSIQRTCIFGTYLCSPVFNTLSRYLIPHKEHLSNDLFYYLLLHKECKMWLNLFIFQISNFLYIACKVFTHKQIVIHIHTQSQWKFQITVINVMEKLSICVKNVYTTIKTIRSQDMTLTVCCDTLGFKLFVFGS